MKCFYFNSKVKNDEPKTTKSISIQSSTSVSMTTDNEMRRSGSESNSRNVSDFSSNSSTKNSFAVMSQRQRVQSEAQKIPTRKSTLLLNSSTERGFQGHKEWVTEVNVLGVVEHQNLVKLMGYCAEDDERGIQRLLIYEYMPNGSVQDHLSTRLQTTLPWATRLTIARDAAQGLAFLHEGMDFQIIFRDFKSSNILLDEHWNAKLSDFGLARLGPSDGLSHVSTAVVGTIGYAAPEYIQTGRLTVKSDVWSYGVFLYELITGRRPLDRNRPKGEEKLLEWVRPHLSNLKKFRLIIDPRLDGKYSIESAHKLVLLLTIAWLVNPNYVPK
ncbi:putative receptor-like protein kinase [Hibiscus syriacus]|uniref:Receptor-like protein kinase n=1 Tax=Hibiscus syriacus TaxID=106335 RepID=A0A6A3AFA3_HIBSY|nr:putative receptor-like protein kinase [Hibiscus syriacus]